MVLCNSLGKAKSEARHQSSLFCNKTHLTSLTLCTSINKLRSMLHITDIRNEN